jgi:hypothetical protein
MFEPAFFFQAAEQRLHGVPREFAFCRQGLPDLGDGDLAPFPDNFHDFSLCGG